MLKNKGSSTLKHSVKSSIRKSNNSKINPNIKKLIKDNNKDRAAQIKKERNYSTIAISRKFDPFTKLENVIIILIDSKLKCWFRENTNLQTAYAPTPRFSSNELINYVDKFVSLVSEGEDYFKELVQFLNNELKDVIFQSKELLKNGQMTFDMLWCLFQNETDCYTKVEDKLSAGTIESTGYESSFFGQNFIIKVKQIQADGKGFIIIYTKFFIREFKGVVPIDSLSVKPLDIKTKEYLIERGKKYQKYGIGPNYVQCCGNMMVKDYWKNILFRSNGRIMIDISTFDKRNPDYPNMRDMDSSDNAFTTIKEDKLHITVPYIKGFSFPLKKWGEFAIDDLDEIEFNDNAFDTLVLDQEKKDIISALVTNSDVGFTDIIKGKSGGCIFLLHGPPGVGKTLTSEAIAETMRVPLYSVSVGELGINPAELEDKLRNILDIASTWKAQILIDEADIFLERRNEHDIIRNAMVGVFLRLLEYHQGVMFLTTNRVKNIDEAFYSRISVALHYTALSLSDKAKIWTNLLVCAGVTGMDIKKLATYDINGRQIKTTIRLAQALAKAKNETISMTHIVSTIKLQEEFVTGMKEKTHG